MRKILIQYKILDFKDLFWLYLDNQGRHEVGYMENTVKLPINEAKGCLFSGEFYVNKANVKK